MELAGSGWSREKQMEVWENFNALSVETGAEVSLHPTTPPTVTFKGLEMYLTLVVLDFCPTFFSALRNW